MALPQSRNHKCLVLSPANVGLYLHRPASQSPLPVELRIVVSLYSVTKISAKGTLVIQLRRAQMCITPSSTLFASPKLIAFLLSNLDIGCETSSTRRSR